MQFEPERRSGRAKINATPSAKGREERDLSAPRAPGPAYIEPRGLPLMRPLFLFFFFFFPSL